MTRGVETGLQVREEEKEGQARHEYEEVDETGRGWDTHTQQEQGDGIECWRNEAAFTQDETSPQAGEIERQEGRNHEEVSVMERGNCGAPAVRQDKTIKCRQNEAYSLTTIPQRRSHTQDGIS